MYRNQQSILSSIKMTLTPEQSAKLINHKAKYLLFMIQQQHQYQQKSNFIHTLSINQQNNNNIKLRVPNINKQIYNQKHFETILKAPIAIPKIKREEQKKVKLPPNIIMRYCPDEENVTENLTETKTRRFSKRPLLLLFGWLESKEIHLEKYRKFWFERGFDVLSVRTLPLHLLFPGFGGRNNGIKVVDFIANHHLVYDEILIHGFSVGGYQLAEVFLYLLENRDKDERYRYVYDSFRGIIVDSLVFAQDCPPGASKAITQSPIFQPMLEKTIDIFLKTTKSFTFNRYLKVQQIMFDNESRLPGCVLHSKLDEVSSIPYNIEIYNGWKSRNPEQTERHCWHDAKHVLIYKKYPEQYTEIIDNFIMNKTLITKAKFTKKINQNQNQ